MEKVDKSLKPDLVVNSKDYFNEIVMEAFSERKVLSSAGGKSYIVELLQFYLHTGNLFSEKKGEGKRGQETLAELYLKAVGSQPAVSKGMFKRLADSSLYISGFFGDSLKRKIVDIDYYAEIGGSAYGHLASLSADDSLAFVYSDFSARFLEYVDVLTCISQKAFFVNQEDLLRLYDRYILTGSKQAEDQLLDRGLLAPTPYAKKVIRQ
ncbi:MAG: hypothetical protein KDD35_00565 [Bdellovibrionales bacterium]|nr:hypothetical protein [Bdellovibrionales bacterium]